MATVEAFKFDGLKLWFYSNDHRPPHIHVKRSGQWEIRVNFLGCTADHLDCTVVRIVSGKGPTKQERKQLLMLVLKYRVELLEEWSAKVIQEDENDE